ncbi:MAG: hypothetical protein ACFCU2_12745 [Acidimicrobiia bacterium]
MGNLSSSRAITLHAAERPHDPALNCPTTLSWLGFDRRTNRLARAFAEMGVVAGDWAHRAPQLHRVLRVGVRPLEAGRLAAAGTGCSW